MLPLAGLIGLHMLLTKQISVKAGLLIGAMAAATSLAMTVLVDSWFWQRWLWPEGEVLWFNTAQNRFAIWLPAQLLLSRPCSCPCHAQKLTNKIDWDQPREHLLGQDVVTLMESAFAFHTMEHGHASQHKCFHADVPDSKKCQKNRL